MTARNCWRNKYLRLEVQVSSVTREKFVILGLRDIIWPSAKAVCCVVYGTIPRRTGLFVAGPRFLFGLFQRGAVGLLDQTGFLLHAFRLRHLRSSFDEIKEGKKRIKLLYANGLIEFFSIRSTCVPPPQVAVQTDQSMYSQRNSGVRVMFSLATVYS